MTSGDIIGFWFGELSADGWTAANHQKWFHADAAWDGQIRRRFAAAIDDAAGDCGADGGRGCAGWRESAEGSLALIILFDQFPRNIYRGGARAFAFDDKALAVCEAGLARDFDKKLAPVCRSFFYLPLEHCEDIRRQRRAVECFTARQAAAPAEHAAAAAEDLRYAEAHRDIIARFGRFPHRNAALARESTAEEAEWLAAGGPRFGQG